MKSKSALNAILILSLLAIVQGRSRRIVCQRVCPKLYSPVCGTDGVTYKNACELTVAACSNNQGVSIGLAQSGECSKPISLQPANPCTGMCPEIYEPVCGNDGQTYPSVCYLKLENCKRKGSKQVSITSEGPCQVKVNPAPQEECQTFCTLDYTPVCGSDGKTYGNMCALNAGNCGKTDVDKITTAYQGECTKSTRSPDCNMRCFKIYAPVCGSDGSTYASHCYLNFSNCGKAETEKIILAYEGPCRTTPTASVEKAECPTICPAIYAPVCGSDNITYSSLCNLNAVNCSMTANAKIRTYSSGECKAVTVPQACPKFCTMIYAPVCGSDGVTYPNECTFNAQTCGKSGVTIASAGECQINGWAVKNVGKRHSF